MGRHLYRVGTSVLPEGGLTMMLGDEVPAEPVYTITLTSGGAMVDGELIRADDGQDDQMAALAEVTTRAARRGRPVRVIAHDSNGPTWLIVSPDGIVEQLTTPHGPPAPSLPPPPVPFGRQPRPRTPLPTPPLPSPPAPAENLAVPSRQHIAGDGPQEGVLPEPHGEHARRMYAAEERGDLAQAVVFADRLEFGLVQALGPDHTWSVHTVTFRAWLLLRHGDSWRFAVEAAVDATFRRYRTGAVPQEDTVRMARNAYAAWCRLVEDDRGAAAALADRVQQAVELVNASDVADDLRARIGQLRSGGT